MGPTVCFEILVKVNILVLVDLEDSSEPTLDLDGRDRPLGREVLQPDFAHFLVHNENRIPVFTLLEENVSPQIPKNYLLLFVVVLVA